MSEEMLIRHCAPTLAGIKTGSLFSCQCRSQKEIQNEVRRLNRVLAPKGIRVLPLRYFKQRALIYLYRPSHLERDLSDGCASALLKQYGYSFENSQRCVVQLVNRLRTCSGFPHEIGLFLGYPPEDVQGFIDNKACHCKCIGCWKVYGDEEKARQTFNRYKKCTETYFAQWSQGTAVERLAVAV